VEVEAPRQGVVTSIVRAALDALLPAPLDHLQVRQDEQAKIVARSYSMACAC
jgi:hypothetical protein